MSGGRGAGNLRAKRRRRVSPRHVLRNESAADLGRDQNDKCAEDDGIEVGHGRPGGIDQVGAEKNEIGRRHADELTL